MSTEPNVDRIIEYCRKGLQLPQTRKCAPSHATSTHPILLKEASGSLPTVKLALDISSMCSTQSENACLDYCLAKKVMQSRTGRVNIEGDGLSRDANHRSGLPKEANRGSIESPKTEDNRVYVAHVPYSGQAYYFKLPILDSIMKMEILWQLTAYLTQVPL
ncbi:hypothetical protein Tsp_02004 [Trichinella spiralis]|uniref:hypothetical protein n=1 Tax=Trichinella spiralis TaxID=6334 RepID=UPI0001EFBAC3|nr:hypothetical protein Tsp_02004 [Trichinella spiralis]